MVHEGPVRERALQLDALALAQLDLLHGLEAREHDLEVDARHGPDVVGQLADAREPAEERGRVDEADVEELLRRRGDAQLGAHDEALRPHGEPLDLHHQ